MQLEISKDTKQLLVPSIPWDFKNPPFDIVDCAESMVNLMLDKKGFGLAANQVGLPYSFFCMRGEPENFFFINPNVVDATGEQVMDWEGCLSFPGLALKQERYHQIRLRFAAPDGATYTKLFKGLSARVVQHEMDHLDGIPWWWNVSKIKFDMAVKKAYKRGWHDYINLTYKGG